MASVLSPVDQATLTTERGREPLRLPPHTPDEIEAASQRFKAQLEAERRLPR